MNVRTYQPGDEARQLAIFNASAGALPGFKPASAEDLSRRSGSRQFDPATRLYAVEGEGVVGYCSWHANGRVGYPWCVSGHEAVQKPLLESALSALQQRGVARAFSAYRTDWYAQHAFFQSQGFKKVRDMVNFVQPIMDLPTTVNRRGAIITGFKPDDLPAIVRMGAGVIQIPPDRLEKYLTQNPYFPVESLFVLRRADGEPQAAAIFLEDSRYADPTRIDSNAPCFRLGAFGTEEQNTKRINGLFSFLVASDRDVTATGLDLLWHASSLADHEGSGVVAAQAPSDARALLGFYQKFFRKQGSFPIFERELS